MTGPAHTGRGRDGGLSLVELMVAMMITGILLAAVGAVFSGTLRAVRQMNVKTATGADVRVTSEAMTRSLRVAYQPKGEASALISADASSISFYALMNRVIGTTSTGTTTTGAIVEPVAIKVVYAWDPTTKCLNESWTPAQAVASPPSGGPYYTWTSGTKTKCLMRTTVGPVFSYYDSGLLTSTGGGTVAPMAVATALTLAQRKLVQSVEVDLIGKDPASANLGGSTASLRVSLENVQIAAGGN